MKKIIKNAFRSLGIEVSRYRPHVPSRFDPLKFSDACVSLKTGKEFRGNMLLSFIIEPFMTEEGGHVSQAHTNPVDSVQIAQIFLDLGYDVDVIHYRNTTFIPQKNYAFFVGARTNFQRIATLLNRGCIKIVHLDTAHWVFNNYSTFRRSLEMQQRKGISIPESNRIIEQNLAIEYADYGTIVGNHFTAGTYAYAKKPIFVIPHSTCAVFPWPEEKSFESCRKNYVWFGSHGFVHKGLDLALDAFSGMPDFNLYVCGPLDSEPAFTSAYHKELFQMPNIHPIGWVDIRSPQFIDIMNRCVGTVYPSCAECGAGNVLTCMQTGVIPVLSIESGSDIDPAFGRTLQTSSVEEIQQTVHHISDLSPDELKRMARDAWTFARTNHTVTRFAEEYKKVILHISQATSLERIPEYGESAHHR